ncbi:MAG: DUF4423 domain-containing protein [Bdellovibrionota bacterium]
MANFFKFSRYKAALKETLLTKKEAFGNQFTFQNMASACRIQKTYLSRALSDDKTHLNSDQLFLASEYLGLNEIERTFLLLLHEREKSVVTKRRELLDREIDAIRKKHAKTEAVIEKSAVVLEGEDLRDYYLDPHIQIIHLFMTVQKYARNPDIVRQRLGLTRDRFTQLVNQLIKMKILSVIDKGAYRVAKASLHLSADSAIYPPHRTLLRLRALDQIQRSTKDQAYSFAVVFSATPSARRKIQDLFFGFLKDVEKEVTRSDPEEVYQLNFDLLSWSEV